MFAFYTAHFKCPFPKIGAQILANQEFVYCFGGKNRNKFQSQQSRRYAEWTATRPLFNDLWSFSIETQTWAKLSTTGQAPNGLAYHCAAFCDNGTKLLIFGGKTSHDPNSKIIVNLLCLFANVFICFV